MDRARRLDTLGGAKPLFSLLLLMVPLPFSIWAFCSVDAPTARTLWTLPTPVIVHAPSVDAYPLGSLQAFTAAAPFATRLLWLDYDLELDVSGQSGEVVLWDDCLGWSATRLRIRLAEDQVGRPVLTWDTLDLISGIRVGFVSGEKLRLTVRNVVPDQWGRSPCQLKLSVEQKGHLTLRRLAVVDGGVIAVASPVPSYQVAVGLPWGAITAGDPLRLSVLTWNRSSIPSPLVRVSLLLEDQGLEPVSPTEVARSGTIVYHAFHLRPFAPGLYRGGIQAISPSGGEALWFGMRVVPESQ